MGELLKKFCNANWTHVPYQGGAAPLRDLESGLIQMMFSSPIPLQPYLEGGRVRVVAAATNERIPSMPDVPTLEEQGIDGMGILAWTGLVAPLGTPVGIRKHLSDVVMEVMSLPHVRERLTAMGVLLRPLPVDRFASYLEEDIQRWQRIVERTGFKRDP